MSTLVQSEITLAKNEGSPDVLTVVGHANFGGYDLYLWDSPTHYTRIGGNDGSQHIDRFSLQLAPADLINCRLVWQGKVRPFGPAPNQPFSVKLIFYQNNTPITACNPQPSASGTFDSTFELIVIMCSFKLA